MSQMRVTPSLTPAGVAVVAAALVLGVLGWTFGYLVLTVIAAAAIAVLVAGAVTTFLVPAIDVARTIEPTRVERGRPAVGLVSVSNPARRRSRPCAAVEQIAGPNPKSLRVEIPALSPGRRVALPYQLPTNRRGSLQVGPLTIVRRDVLGLWHSQRPVGDTVSLLVQPRIYRVAPGPAGRSRHMEGPVSDSAPRGTQTFHSLREYTPGDDIRRVHWRSTARTGTLMVREHVDTSLPSTVVVIDLRASQYDGDGFEEAIDVAASVVHASQERGFPVRVVTTDGRSIIARAGQRGQVLRDFLTNVTTVDDSVDGHTAGDLGRAAIEVVRGREHDAIAVVTGTIDAADVNAIATMTRRFARPMLATLRPVAGVRWSGGVHLDGATASAALARWQWAATARGTLHPPAVGVAS